MKRRMVLCVFAAGGVLAVATLPEAQVWKPGDAEQTYLREITATARQLRAPDPAARARVEYELSNMRSTVIVELMKVAASADADVRLGSPESYAMQLLGKWRAREACSLLVKHIECTSLGSPRSLGRPFREFPAVEALVEIGSPAAEAVTHWLSADTRPTEQRLRLSAFVIWATDGQQVGLARLQAALEEVKKRKDDKRYRSMGDQPEENLTRMVELFRSIDFKDPRQWPRPAPRAASEKNPATVP